jgi:hypothetical protein
MCHPSVCGVRFERKASAGEPSWRRLARGLDAAWMRSMPKGSKGEQADEENGQDAESPR